MSPAEPLTLEQAHAALERHHADFLAMLERAEDCWRARRFDEAAVRAQAAAGYAWFHHTGCFASPELEALLSGMGRALAPARRAAPREAVLHVLTQAYQTGGPTQAVACWIEQDGARSHRVCLTRQGPGEWPAKLAARLPAPGGLLALDRQARGMRQRAQALRAAAAGAEMVVLHTHPYDVLPLIAFGAGYEGPPVVYVNHGDHTFWIGRQAAGLVVHLRDSGRALAQTRRGIDASRSIVMPRPLRLPPAGLPRDEARRRLGLDAQDVLIVTCADAAKYVAVDGPSLLSLVLPVLRARPRARLLAAGPRPEGEWARAEAATAGRVRALGRLPDVALLQQAADICLDSFPFSSLTSLLEAAGTGAAVLSYGALADGECDVLAADTPGIDAQLCAPREPRELRDTLARLVADAAWRRARGEALREAVLATHAPARFRAHAAALQERAHACRTASEPWSAPRCSGRLDVLVACLMARTGYARGRDAALADHLGLLPARARTAAWAGLRARGAAPPLRGLWPEWMLARIAPGWRRSRRSLQKVASTLGERLRPAG